MKKCPICDGNNNDSANRRSKNTDLVFLIIQIMFLLMDYTMMNF